MTGGGSGGHITPILAVAYELKQLSPGIKIIYIGPKGDALGDIPVSHESIDEVYVVRAGKWRRYHGEGLKQLLDLKTLAKNMRDAIFVLIGLVQSWRLLGRINPDLVFIKGGFVGVPIGLAAAARRIAYCTHDSDAIPGLANRLISRWARLHTVALPKEVYSYPKHKTMTVGIPLARDFVPVTPQIKSHYRKELNIDEKSKLLFIIGGGLGAQRVNSAVAESLPHLLKQFPELQVIHVVGRNNVAQLQKLYSNILSKAEQDRVGVKDFIQDVYRYSGAADVIITRAGATNLAEFAVQGKACIVIPNPLLTGGHQLKNAQYLAIKQAAILITEGELLTNTNIIASQTSLLLKNNQLRDQLGSRLASFAQPEATQKLAQILLNLAKQESK